MSDAFDPYYIWLGIPPDDQPPNHYRLLGIELFEASGEVIEAAANRQMAYMQEVSSGEEHIDEAQKILGELSKARVCLLNGEKKTAYDADLRASFDSLDQSPEEQEADQATQTPAVASPRDKSFLPPQTPAETTAQTEDDEGDRAPILGTHAPRVGPTKKHRTSTRATTRTTTRKKKKKQDATVPILMGLGAVLTLIVLVVVFSSTGPKTPKEPTAREPQRQKKEFARKPKEKIKNQCYQNQGATNLKRKRSPLTSRQTFGRIPTVDMDLEEAFETCSGRR